MNRLASISASPTLKEFAHGIAQDSIQPVAEFLAPTVPVATGSGRYKVYTQKNRFRIPDTFRGIGGRAAELRFEATDALYNCEPHALDFPVDNLERLEDAQLGDMLKEGAQAIAEVAGLAHEKQVIDAALAAVGAGTGKTWNDAADPCDDVDGAVLDMIKAASYGSAMNVGILFGATAWKIFKNHSKVRARFIVGDKAKGSGLGVAVPNEESAATLFIGTPKVRTSYMVYDTTAEGLTKSMAFVLDTAVLVFARKQNPTRLDPSFMKTFRLMGRFMVPGSYVREDGRAEVAKFDWSEDVKVTNSAACIRYNISAS